MTGSALGANVCDVGNWIEMDRTLGEQKPFRPLLQFRSKVIRASGRVMALEMNFKGEDQ